MKTAIATSSGSFWLAGGKILLLDGRDNPPMIYPSEMMAVESGLCSPSQLAAPAREREARIIQLASAEFFAGRGPHPAKVRLP